MIHIFYEIISFRPDLTGLPPVKMSENLDTSTENVKKINAQMLK
jgi:hypothetical protein